MEMDHSLHEGRKAQICNDHGKEKVGWPPLFELLKRKKAEDKSFLPEDEFEDLNNQQKMFHLYEPDSKRDNREKALFDTTGAGGRPFTNTDTFFPKSYESMWSYIEGPLAAHNYNARLGNEIRIAYREIIIGVFRWRRKEGFERASYRLKNKMEHFTRVFGGWVAYNGAP
ncbi:hypothetical protein BDZ45DRAFT_792798 [Acephala macrosclerotiorum]|nr:hypothetical protein BDZ45DRAFT_792798 [Acephala macrosclerotiorum]